MRQAKAKAKAVSTACNRACKKEKKKIKKLIDLDKLPSNEVFSQLMCVKNSVYRGLYYCMEDILKGSYKSPGSTKTP